MNRYELREFLEKVGEEGLERMNRALQTEGWNYERWAIAIAVAANERRFCDYWHLPTEAEKAMMVRAAKLKYHTLAFWVAIGVAVPPWVDWTVHSVYSPGHRNATPRRGHSDPRHHPSWTPAMPPGCGGGEPLRSPSRADRPRQTRSAHRANGSSGNTGS
jgi:hypothetical protein